jgi:hypothetical protein
MTVRAKFILLGVLCAVALGATVWAAALTYQAFESWHQHYLMVQAGDVRTIRSWMTLPYIAHVYRVPTDYLYVWLDVPETSSTRHVTLEEIAEIQQKPIDQVIQSVQTAILTYRSQHSQLSPPAPSIFGEAGYLSPPLRCRCSPFCWQDGGLWR